MLVTYVDRCTSCSCSSLRDEGGHRSLPGAAGCGRSCKCHATATNVRAVDAALAADAARYRFWRRTRAEQQGVVAVR